MNMGIGMGETLAPDVLVIEPEALSCRYLVQALQGLHLTLQVAQDWPDGRSAALPAQAHLVILGMGQGTDDNLLQLQQVRRQCPQAVVMGVLPRMASSERCALLNAGLDFILEKPFFMDECASAVRAILRRHPLRHRA